MSSDLLEKIAKHRLLERCFNEMPAKASAHLIEKFAAHFHEGRFGTLWYAVSELLHIEKALRFAWSKAKFLAGGTSKNDSADEHSLKVDLADEGIRSPLFWGYLFMLHNVGEIFDALARFGEGCICHSDLPQFNGVSRRKRGQELLNMIGDYQCPCRALQAPSFAANRHFEIMEDVLSKANANLLMSDTVNACTTADRDVILTDFANCRRHIRFCLTTRMSWCRYLPWVLVGVAHHVWETAVDCAKRALQLYDTSPEGTTHHPLTLLFCSVETMCGQQLRLFARKVRRLYEMPCLHLQVARLRFIPVSERYVEGLHALLKRSIARATSISAAHVAFCAVQEVLRERLLENPSLITSLADKCLETRSPVRCLKQMGLWRHPAVMFLRACVSESQLNRQFAPQVGEILYHVDRHSMLADLPNDSDEEPEDVDGNDGDEGGGGQPPAGGGQPPAGGGQPPAGGGQPPAGGGGPPPAGGGGQAGGGAQGAPGNPSGGSLYDRLLCKSAVEFLQTRSAECQLYLSLGPKLSRGPEDFMTSLSAMMRLDEGMIVFLSCPVSVFFSLLLFPCWFLFWRATTKETTYCLSSLTKVTGTMPPNSMFTSPWKLCVQASPSQISRSECCCSLLIEQNLATSLYHVVHLAHRSPAWELQS